jgi:hypothetical protein
MYLLYCDETNLDPRENTFFIYGGVTIPAEQAKSLSDTVEKIRQENGIKPEFLLKFNPKPDNMKHVQFSDVKQQIIEAAIAHNCTLIVSMILHSIATSPDAARRNEINRVLLHFNGFLGVKHSHGLALIDRFSDAQIDAHLRKKFAIGITGLPYCKAMRLERIVGFHHSAIGQSHFSSVVDIVLGSLRFAINAHANDDKSRMKSSIQILKIIRPLFKRSDFTGEVPEMCLFFSKDGVDSPILLRYYFDIGRKNYSMYC